MTQDPEEVGRNDPAPGTTDSEDRALADEQSRAWWAVHASIATAAAVASILALAAIALGLHVAAVPDFPSSQHVAAGDYVFFGMLATLVLVAGWLTINRQRHAIIPRKDKP